jgi:hypothetical protein
VSSTSFKIVISRHYLHASRLGSLLQSLVVHRLYRDDKKRDKNREVEDDKTRAHYIRYNSKEAFYVCATSKSTLHRIQL